MNPARKRFAVLAALALGASATTGAQQRVATNDLSSYWLPKTPIAPDYLLAATRYGLEGCYLVDFEVDSTGRVANASIVYSEIDFVGLPGLGTKPRGRERTQAKKAEEAAVLAAVRAVQYEAAQGNAEKMPVRTLAPPIIVSMLTLEKPDDPAAVAVAKAKYEARRQDWNRKCDVAAGTLQGSLVSAPE